jgi:hypothetical protein
MDKNVTKILAASGGAFIGGAAMKTLKKADGTTNPIASLGSLGVGIYLAMKGKSETVKAIGLGLASVGVIGTVAKVAEKIPAMQKFTPSVNGLGELYEDEDGNIIELGGVNGPELVQDDNGQTYMIEGLNGDDDEFDEDLLGIDGDDDEYYDDEDLEGLSGDDMSELL